MAAMLSNVTSFIATYTENVLSGGVLYWMKSFLTAVTNNPVLFVFVVAVPLAGFGIGILRRLINVN